METLALRISDSVKDGSKLTTENSSIHGKAAALAAYHGEIVATDTSPGHTTWTTAR